MKFKNLKPNKPYTADGAKKSQYKFDNEGIVYHRENRSSEWIEKPGTKHNWLVTRDWQLAEVKHTLDDAIKSCKVNNQDFVLLDDSGKAKAKILNIRGVVHIITDYGFTTDEKWLEEEH